jgi:hypothetical protein
MSTRVLDNNEHLKTSQQDIRPSFDQQTLLNLLTTYGVTKNFGQCSTVYNGNQVILAGPYDHARPVGTPTGQARSKYSTALERHKTHNGINKTQR